MGSSSNPVPITDGVEDDEFDWEAAVREIDIACAQSTTDVTHQGEFFSNKSSNFHSSTSSRQSTLERFLGISSNSKDIHRKDIGKQKVEGFGNGVIRNYNKGEEKEGDVQEIPSFIKIDPAAAKTWIYPVSATAPLREYQYSITQTALFCNTLVALPTGLGKTFIAAVVMYNYFRWFPEGKIVFAAPSRPLVMQQIEACHKIVGIPQEWTIDLTGQTSPTKRACYWKSKRVFFVTPQVLEKDIQSGACLVKQLVCLVIDEAHRATGNYSYCVVVRELMSVPVPLRILALTATPGSKQLTIQHIIDNLQISTLEYRNESDHDVKPYVHDRKIELIKVPLGKDAVEIDKLMMDVILPYVNRLSQLGILPNRDFQTLSPCDILNSRDKFRQQPPTNLPQSRYGELEGCFGVLVTLYHIRKLLSSHGIRPAFEMLDEKLHQGSFARLMCRNEGLMKAKLLMQQNMSHGAPSPKLSKMLEVLIDHFKTKGKLNSRVIIFSNFRGSVRDIMDALKNIEECVKPMEFIGQSSGKTLKGQTQKVQQAVLEKFRAGGYNVIVATSIGEEGLDIMEVDLVICFDANISPLRMIQRMGRTGRKHDGRVVLACEGSELRGYMRKQSTSKVMKKHMRNGGTTNFCFHSSSRMVPHLFKPEVQVVELSIQQFVPRASKKVCEDQQLTDSPFYKTKLTDSENCLIAKYFNSTHEDTWKPSLIAFPHFQAFPSRVHRVAHSFRSTMLIEAMQLLQEIPCSKDENAFDMGKTIVQQHSIEAVKENIEHSKGELLAEIPVSSMKICNKFPEDCKREGLNVTEKPIGDIATKETDQVKISASKSVTHSFLFDSGFVSVDDLGNVEISSVPQLPGINFSQDECANSGRTVYSSGLKQDHVQVGDLAQQNDHFVAQMESCGDGVVKSQPVEESVVCETPSPMQVSMQKSNKRGADTDSPKLTHEPCIDVDNMEFSPRLSNYILSGVVPESPINYADVPAFGGFTVPDLPSTPKVHIELQEKYLQENREASNEKEACIKNVPSLTKNEEIQRPEEQANEISPILPVKEIKSPVEKLPNTSFSEDLQLNDEGMSESVEPKYKLKRLRKHGDLLKKRPPDCDNKKIARSLNFTSFGPGGRVVQFQGKKVKQRRIDDAKVFIEEEAEVSSDVTVSEDEEDQQENNSCDSFIDDKTCPTAPDTQADVGRIDMMAIYRRSLLSQSPLQRMVDTSSDVTPNSVSRANETATTSGRESLLQTPENISKSTARDSDSVYLINSSSTSRVVASHAPEHYYTNIENNKRKASLYEAGHMPIQNLENEFLVHSKIPRQQVGSSVLQVQVNRVTESASTCFEPSLLENVDAFFDEDQFFNDIDFDAIEEQAAKLLRCKSECVVTKQNATNEPEASHITLPCSPTFDLGI